MKTIVGLYDNWSDAQQVVQDLTNSGIDRDQISMVAGDREEKYGSTTDRTDDQDGGDAALGGAATGAAVGGIGGVLLSLSALAIPGIGPVVAAGPLVAGLVGAGVGAAVGGLVGALIDAGVPEEEAGYYAEGVRRGSTMVTVGADDADANRVVQIMNRHNPVDVNERASSWRESGWSGFDATDETYKGVQTDTQTHQNAYTGAPDRRGTRSANDVVEQELHVGKRQTGDGGVRVHTHMVAEPVEQQVRLRDEEVDMERSDSDFTHHDTTFRNHYQTNFANRGYAYERYEPAYRYGWNLASDERYQGRDWSAIEADAQRSWHERNPDSPWEDFKDAVRSGWQEVRRRV